MEDIVARLKADMKKAADKNSRWVIADLHDAVHVIVALRSLVDAVDTMHQPWPQLGQCVECGLPWPCRTYRLLEQDEIST